MLAQEDLLVIGKLIKVETELIKQAIQATEDRMGTLESKVDGLDKKIDALSKKLDQAQQDISEILPVIIEHHDSQEKRVKKEDHPGPPHS